MPSNIFLPPASPPPTHPQTPIQPSIPNVDISLLGSGTQISFPSGRHYFRGRPPPPRTNKASTSCPPLRSSKATFDLAALEHSFAAVQLGTPSLRQRLEASINAARTLVSKLNDREQHQCVEKAITNLGTYIRLRYPESPPLSANTAPDGRSLQTVSRELADSLISMWHNDAMEDVAMEIFEKLTIPVNRWMRYEHDEALAALANALLNLETAVGRSFTLEKPDEHSVSSHQRGSPIR
jgi:hypothetical protein